MQTPLDNKQRLPVHDIMCIDCKSFFASTEAIKRGLHPLAAKIAVMSREESSGGLILAASPYSKQNYGVKLGSRRFEINDQMDVEMVEPHMADYVALNYKINLIYRQFTDDKDWYPYSIDESFIDVSHSHNLFGTNKQIAKKIQDRVFHETGIITTIGAGQNPLLAKLALDNAAKEKEPWFAEWGYDDVPNTIWKIPQLVDMWGIGSHTATKLNNLGIYTVAELAHADVKELKKKFGILGEQLYYHAWGIDYSDIEKKYLPSLTNKGYNNSQILMRDYTKQSELLTVLSETADQVATRLRKNNVVAEIVSIFIGMATTDKRGRTHFSAQMHIEATNATDEIAFAVRYLLKSKWDGSAVRSVGVSCSRISKKHQIQFNIFQDPIQTIDHEKLEAIIDTIRHKYGYSALIRASSKTKGGTAIERAGLLGGHQA
ncbi:Y-family DNA polymerase [Lentilactobacillus kisonensis]|uniref:DNA polymerase IV n=1 Tax=Lentilactobacillus kisonensis DSM 19906 = JCM 15041 TaxID=1423766 RepID=A0A0R1NSQ4_9LACO|nr:Y-family DNA polymerase [Lentilactobacillus kisonensis]KRL20506.1 DNA polymerase IV [Lentilactobacillus kisonensis DSM 19906 = JCM 15041]